MPVYANTKLVSIHLAKGGKKKVSLPKKYTKVVEVFSNKVVAQNTDSFEYEFATPDTVLFELFE